MGRAKLTFSRAMWLHCLDCAHSLTRFLLRCEPILAYVANIGAAKTWHPPSCHKSSCSLFDTQSIAISDVRKWAECAALKASLVSSDCSCPITNSRRSRSRTPKMRPAPARATNQRTAPHNLRNSSSFNKYFHSVQSHNHVLCHGDRL